MSGKIGRYLLVPILSRCQITDRFSSYPPNPNPGNRAPLDPPKDPWGQPIQVTAADTAVDPSDANIPANPDDDLISSQDIEPATVDIQGYKLPGCPDVYPSAIAKGAPAPSSSTVPPPSSSVPAPAPTKQACTTWKDCPKCD